MVQGCGPNRGWEEKGWFHQEARPQKVPWLPPPAQDTAETTRRLAPQDWGGVWTSCCAKGWTFSCWEGLGHLGSMEVLYFFFFFTMGTVSHTDTHQRPAQTG